MTGRLIGVVGPSGVGKDTLMPAMAAAEPGLSLVRRVITRDAEAGGEVFEAVSEGEFARLAAEGAFCLHWEAHGLRYGIRREVCDRVAAGETMLVNLSRRVIGAAVDVVPDLLILNVTARPETLAARLKSRGREGEAEISRRLARADLVLPGGVTAVAIPNDGPLDVAVARALGALHPVRA
jgi:ribose 1,5-bisphosphokinase